MMLGAFVAVGLANDAYLGLPFWLACIGAILAMAAIGWLLERAILRRVFGQSQVAVMILTIAIGFALRFIAGAIWGHEPQVLESPIAGVNPTFGALVLGLDEIAVIVVTLVLTGLLFAFFNRTKLGVAMQGSSRNQLAACDMGIPVKRIHGLTWALAGAAAAVAGILLRVQGLDRSQYRIPRHQGVRGGGHRRIRLPAGSAGGRLDRRADRAVRSPLHRGRLLADRPLRGHAPGADRPSPRSLRAGPQQEGLSRWVSLQDQLRPRHPPLSGCAAGTRVRGARRARGGAALAARRLPDRRGHQCPDMGHRGHGTDAADGPCRPAESRPRGVPGRRLLRQRHPDESIRPAVPRILHAGGAPHGSCRRARRDSGAQAPRHLSRHRDSRPVDPHRGRHRPRRALGRRRGRTDCPGDLHRRGGDGSLRVPGPLLLALSRGRGARHPGVPQHPARPRWAGPSWQSGIRRCRRRRWA